MKFSSYTFMVLSTLLLVGCAAAVEKVMDDDVMQEEQEEMMDEMKDDEMMDNDMEEETDEMMDTMVEDDDEMEGEDDMMEEMMRDASADAKAMADKEDSEEGMQKEELTVEESAAVEVLQKEPVAKKKGQYTAYADGVIGNGEKSVLFFHAEWCPVCQRDNGILSRLYSEGEYPISVYKIDYDTASDLKQRYGVVTQDTFVLIDGSGNAISTQSFVDESTITKLISS